LCQRRELEVHALPERGDVEVQVLAKLAYAEVQALAELAYTEVQALTECADAYVQGGDACRQRCKLLCVSVDGGPEVGSEEAEDGDEDHRERAEPPQQHAAELRRQRRDLVLARTTIRRSGGAL